MLLLVFIKQKFEMIKFLDTKETSKKIKEMIENADDYITIISPYMKINKDLKKKIIDKEININIVYGKRELNKDEYFFLKSCDNVSIMFCENLHAKCYFSEKECIITSMNLYEFSELNNFEMGIYFDEKEEKIFNKTYEEAAKIIKNSNIIKLSKFIQKNLEYGRKPRF